MHTELQTVLGGRLPTVADLPQLRYARMIFTEALRLYPPAWLMTRRAREAVTIGDYRFAPGTFFLLSPYLAHHDGRPRQRLVPPGMPISPLAGGRASVSPKGLRGWKASWCWRRWPRRGACSWAPVLPWSPGGW